MTITKGDFQVSIIQNNVFVQSITDANGNFFCMKDCEEYSIFLKNNGNAKCDAKIYIDGELIGVWRISPLQSSIIYSPICVPKKLIFKNNPDLQGQNFEKGKIIVEFLSEKSNAEKPDVLIPYTNDLYPITLNKTTVLGDECSIYKNLVELIEDVDETKSQTIEAWFIEQS